MSFLLNRLRARSAESIAQPAFLVQLVVARIGPDHLVRMDHEEVVQQVVHVLFAQPVGRQTRDPQVRVLVAAVGVGQQLLQAGWAPD